MKTYSTYKNSGVEWLGEIPEHWETLPIRAIFEERNEKNDGPKTDFILSVTKDRGVIPYDEKGAIGNNKSEDIERYKVVYEGDFVINKMNVVIGSLGMSKYFGAFSQVYLVYKPKSSKININYYSYIFSNPSFYKSLIRYCTGIMELRESLNKDDFKKISLPFPEYTIQSKIVSFLDNKTTKIDQAIAIKQKQIELLKERRQILILKAVTRGINTNVKLKYSGLDWIGEIPEHWKLLKINYFSKVGNGSTPSRENMKFWNEGKFPWLNSSSVNKEIIIDNDQFVTKRALKECHLPILEKGTILVAITGEGKTRGKAAICEIKATINQHLAYIKVDPKIAFNYFIMYVFHSMYDKLRADSSSQGSTKGAITCEAIKQIKLPIPPIPEQEEIVKFIETATTKIATAISLKEQEIEKLKEYKMSLIDGVVTGKMKVC